VTCEATLPILSGHNQWLLMHSNVGAPTKSDVIDNVASFLSDVFDGELGSSIPIDGKWIMGAARPVFINSKPLKSGNFTGGLSGTIIGTLQNLTDPQCNRMRVASNQPWLVIVDFDWRGDDTSVPWPRSPNETAQDLDILLIGASHQGESMADDRDRTEEILDSMPEVKQFAIGAGTIGLVAAGILAVALLRKR